MELFNQEIELFKLEMELLLQFHDLLSKTSLCSYVRMYVYQRFFNFDVLAAIF